MPRHVADMMIPAKNYPRQVQFYRDFLNMETVFAGKEFTLLRDRATKQTLCLADKTALSASCVSVETDNLRASLEELMMAGGKLKKRWEVPHIVGAICEDPEGREIMLWQGDRQAAFG